MNPFHPIQPNGKPGQRCLQPVMLAALAVMLMLSQHAAAARVMAVDADTQFAYAEHLFSISDYLSAVNEYRRFVFLFPQETRVEAAAFRIGVCYAAAGQFDQALQSFSKVIDMFGESPLAVQAYFRMSDILLAMGRTASAITALHNLATVTEDPNVRDEVHYRIGWIHLEMGEWDQARAYFQKIGPENADPYRLQALNRGLAEVAAEKRKNPKLAGMLSIIPGGGQLYCRRYQDALVSFLLNGGLMYAAYEAFDHEMYALAGVIAFVEVGFYSGNIYGAVSSAHKYNRNRDKSFVDHLKEKVKVNLSARPANRGLELSLHIPF